MSLQWLKEWYMITIAEQQEMMELGEFYKTCYWSLRGRLDDLAKEIKEREK